MVLRFRSVSKLDAATSELAFLALAQRAEPLAKLLEGLVKKQAQAYSR